MDDSRETTQADDHRRAKGRPTFGWASPRYTGGCMRMRCERTQWAVGQGFFHSSELQDDDGTSLRYVYDCGAMPKFKQELGGEIAECARTLQTTVDLLYLSHFDYDHVSGVKELLNAVTVRRAVIPLVPMSERLMVLGRFAAVSAGGRLPGEYVRLVADPRAWFTSRDVAVTEVLPDEDNGTVTLEPLRGEDLPDGPVPAHRAVTGVGASAPTWVIAPWVVRICDRRCLPGRPQPQSRVRLCGCQRVQPDGPAGPPRQLPRRIARRVPIRRPPERPQLHMEPDPLLRTPGLRR